MRLETRVLGLNLWRRDDGVEADKGGTEREAWRDNGKLYEERSEGWIRRGKEERV